MSEHRLLVFSELRSLKGIVFSRQHIGALVRRGIFPKPVKTPGGGQVRFWIEREVDLYIESLMVLRDEGGPDEATTRRVARMMEGRRAAAKQNLGTVAVPRRQRRA
jgi:predicted DNA-binding transcriptional regulator AlpA